MFEIFTKEALGDFVKANREDHSISQNDLIKKIGGKANRSHLAHLEQGLRIPPPEILSEICTALKIPKRYWKTFTEEKSLVRLDFESLLTELVGIHTSLVNQDNSIISVVEKLLSELFGNSYTADQAYHTFCRLLVFYDVQQTSKKFFDRYLTAEAFKSTEALRVKIASYQKDAIRLFSSFEEAYKTLNYSTQFDELLKPLQTSSDEIYRGRTDWLSIKSISDTKLPYLGYIAAARVKKEEKERTDLSNFLVQLANKKKEGTFNLADYSEKIKRKYDSLLRQFNSKIEHGLFSPMFMPSPELLMKEARYIKPDEGTDLAEMEETQRTAYENLSNYLSADFMDVYVATSMRNDADFISVNNFCKSLFAHVDIKPLKLRYFNPTQSWIEDRVAKGLVEALMLKRADFCIYMAQKDDTFGKDSEASVSLGQGKPVIVYVPKLLSAEEKIDSEVIGRFSKQELLDQIKPLDADFVQDVDDYIDEESLMGKLLTLQLKRSSSENLNLIIKSHWADFDLYGEIERRVSDQAKKTSLIGWLNNLVKENKSDTVPSGVADDIVSILVANAIRYEKRANIFKKIHPLALQVILSTGVLNGILVTRSVDSCAHILRNLITNNLNLALEVDQANYQLIETTTRSTIRVISRHKLLSNSFSTFYRKQ